MSTPATPGDETLYVHVGGDDGPPDDGAFGELHPIREVLHRTCSA